MSPVALERAKKSIEVQTRTGIANMMSFHHEPDRNHKPGGPPTPHPEELLAAQAPAFAPPPPPAAAPAPAARSDDLGHFDIFEWAPKYASCQRFFLDHAQFAGPVQAVAAFLNILLPCQRTPPVVSAAASAAHPASAAALGLGNGGAPPQIPGGPPPPFTAAPPPPSPTLSLFPYIRRLVVTGLDFPGVLHGFFGNDWAAGIGPLHEQERRNYMFAAKSGGWGKAKREYDMGPLETVPFLRPLQGVVEPELLAAERSWSEFMAFEDWMVGPRAPPPEGRPRDGAAPGD